MGDSGLLGACPLDACSDGELLPGKNPKLSPGSVIAKNNPVFRRYLWATEELERHLVFLLGFFFSLPHTVELVPVGSAQTTGELHRAVTVNCPTPVFVNPMCSQAAGRGSHRC